MWACVLWCVADTSGPCWPHLRWATVQLDAAAACCPHRLFDTTSVMLSYGIGVLSVFYRCSQLWRSLDGVGGCCIRDPHIAPTPKKLSVFPAVATLGLRSCDVCCMASFFMYTQGYLTRCRVCKE